MSIRRRLLRSSIACSALLAIASSAAAQCLSWENGFGYAQPGVGNLGYGYFEATAMVGFDDGTGPALYAGGQFQTAGDVSTSNIAKWDGTRWSALGAGLQGFVHAMVVFDDGSGPALFVAHNAGASYNSIIDKWNGASWSTLPGVFDFYVSALAVFDDGTGPALYAGGSFASIDAAPIGRIARWTGSAWASVGGSWSNGSIAALRVFDDGSGPALFAGGAFSAAGGVPANSIAKWNGSVWSPLGSGVTSGYIYCLTDFDDGTGPALFAGGGFMTAGGSPANRVAKWNGSTWSAIGSGSSQWDLVGALAAFDDGTGLSLYAAVDLGVGSAVAKWTGSQWTYIGGGFDFQFTYSNTLKSLLVLDEGDGPHLYVGGAFQVAGNRTALGVARRDGAQWSPLQPPSGNGSSGTLRALARFDGPQGPELYAGGDIREAGDTPTSGIARWNGSSWSNIGYGVRTYSNTTFQFSAGFVYALTVADGPAASPALYVGGAFTDPGYGLARWDGVNWTGLYLSILPGQYGTVYALAVDDMTSPSALFVGGGFNSTSSGSASNIARYDPHTSTWSSLGSGANSPVFALATFDDGSGLALYAAGSFTTAGGIPAQRIARWNGSSWSALGTGFDNNALALKVFDDGSGSALYAGGGFTTAGGNPAPGIARWNGTSWSPVGNGLSSGVVFALSTYDDGSGPALYATGGFTSSGATATSSIAKWNGQNWTALGSGLNGFGQALCTFDDGHGTSGPELVVGGDFTTAGANASHSIAAWRRCGAPFDTFCFGDGTLASCPCGNQGLPGHGCDNSIANGGGRLFANGTTQPDTVVIHASAELPNALSIFLQGNALVSGSARFGDGLRCVGGSLKRLYVKNASGGAVSAPGAGDPSITARSAALGDPIAPGSTRYYQTYYRDPNLAFCPPPQGDSWNVTNGAIVAW